MQIIVRLLHPDTPEGASVFAGMLVTRVMMKARAQIQAHVPDLLKAVLGKLNAVSTVTNIQQLIMVFAQIIMEDMPSVMAFLTSQCTPHALNNPPFNLLDGTAGALLGHWCHPAPEVSGRREEGGGMREDTRDQQLRDGILLFF